MLHSYVTDMAARVTPNTQIPGKLPLSRTGPPTVNFQAQYLLQFYQQNLYRSWPNHSQGSCEWVDCVFYKFSSNVLIGRICGIRALTKHNLCCWPWPHHPIAQFQCNGRISSKSLTCLVDWPQIHIKKFKKMKYLNLRDLLWSLLSSGVLILDPHWCCGLFVTFQSWLGPIKHDIFLKCEFGAPPKK